MTIYSLKYNTGGAIDIEKHLEKVIEQGEKRIESTQHALAHCTISTPGAII